MTTHLLTAWLAGLSAGYRIVLALRPEPPRPLTDAERRAALTLIVTNGEMERRYRVTQPGDPQRYQKLRKLMLRAANIRAAERVGETR